MRWIEVPFDLHGICIHSPDKTSFADFKACIKKQHACAKMVIFRVPERNVLNTMSIGTQEIAICSHRWQLLCIQRIRRNSLSR